MANGPEAEQVLRAELRGLLPSELGSELVPSLTWDRRGATSLERQAARQAEFRLGRECAVRALRQVGWSGMPLAPPADHSSADAIEVENSVDERQVVGVGAHRQPLWPAGFVGSLTHSRNWTWAVAACDQCYRGVGIDTEAIIDEGQGAELRGEIGHDDDWTRLEPTALPAALLTTLLWSAKEAYFKLWFPLQGCFLTGQDVRLLEIAAVGSGRGAAGESAIAGSLGLVLGQVDAESGAPHGSLASGSCKTHPLAVQAQTTVVAWWTSQDVFSLAVEPTEGAPVFTNGETG